MENIEESVDRLQRDGNNINETRESNSFMINNNLDINNSQNSLHNYQTNYQNSNIFHLSESNYIFNDEKKKNHRFSKEEDDFIYEIANKWKSDKRGRGLWTFIAEILNRNDSCVSSRYRMIEKAIIDGKILPIPNKLLLASSSSNNDMPYTNEEDMVIKNNILEWKSQNKLTGLWSYLSQLMNRSSCNIYRRYEALESYDSSLTLYQSHKGVLRHVLDPSRNGRKFTKEEDEYILQTVLRWKQENRGRGLWIYIGKVLNRNDSSITTRYDLLMKVETSSIDDITNKLTGKKFTSEEDETLKRLVNEWKSAGKGKGIWVFIAKEMNRRENSIIARYKNIMKNEES